MSILRAACILLVLCILTFGCVPSQPKDQKKMLTETPLSTDLTMDFQGHRGCRGLMPENTIPGFLSALDLGVNTLEMDVVITSDRKVICSHEPWFSHTIALDPDGRIISEQDEKNHCIYKMTYAETRAYDCGMRPHPRFPDQAKLPVRKPLLKDVILAADSHALETNRPLPYYNIETKCTPEGDGIFHPSPSFFSDLVMEVVQETGIADRVIIQSFDIRTLQYIKTTYPKIKLALLIENEGSPEIQIEKLGFYPDIYSPYHILVDQDLVAFCQRHNMKLIPWTVNEVWEMENLIALGVDGIISDYPDRLAEVER